MTDDGKRYTALDVDLWECDSLWEEGGLGGGGGYTGVLLGLRCCGFEKYASRWGRMAKVELLNFRLFRVLSHVPSGKLLFDLAPPSGTPKRRHFGKMKIIKKP